MDNKAEKNFKKFKLVKIISSVLLLFIIITSPVFSSVQKENNGYAKKIKITKNDLLWFGDAIFQRECDGDIEKLAAWNKGEEFASFGIGHFIWYPKDYEGPFDESFPTFLKFLKQRGVKLPGWLEQQKKMDCPWATRRDFYRNIDSYKMRSIKQFLANTRYQQSLFIVHRFMKAFPKMMRAASYDKKKHIRKQFFRVADSSLKLYALIDYVNFKGEGIKLSERYNNVGWGLLQVLEEMQGTKKGDVALCDFARAAETVLTRRVINSPIERNEHRWLTGWKNRVNYYRTLTRYL